MGPVMIAVVVVAGFVLLVAVAVVALSIYNRLVGLGMGHANARA
jgi:hypothetical protein